MESPYKDSWPDSLFVCVCVWVSVCVCVCVWEWVSEWVCVQALQIRDAVAF